MDGARAMAEAAAAGISGLLGIAPVSAFPPRSRHFSGALPPASRSPRGHAETAAAASARRLPVGARRLSDICGGGKTAPELLNKMNEPRATAARKEYEMQLAPDDLTPGLFVTLLETEAPARHEGPTAAPAMDYTAAGAVLRVISVSLPFVLVQNMTPGMLRGPRMFPVDLRRSNLSALSDDYVRAAIADPPPTTEPISLIDAEIIQGANQDDEGADDPGTDFGSGIYFLGGS